VVAFRFSETFRTQNPDVNQKWIQTLLRAKGWIVPNYELAPDLSNIDILRVVVRETVSEVLIERLLTDIVGSLDTACASTTHVPVCRLKSRSLWPRPTPLPTLSTLSLKRTLRAMRFVTERSTWILGARVLEPTPNNVKERRWKSRRLNGGRADVSLSSVTSHCRCTRIRCVHDVCAEVSNWIF
jgi:hypothetical protein